MIENFHLAAILKSRTQIRVLRIPLHRQLQEDLSERWYQQHEDFSIDTHNIAFDPGYTPGDDEVFRIPDYNPPSWLADHNSNSIADIDNVSANDILITKGIVGFGRLDGREFGLFQNFVRSRIIRPGRFLFLEQDTYRSSDRLGITLADELSATWDITNNELRFRSFRAVNTFLQLADYYEEASEQQIRSILSHDRFSVDNPDLLAVGASQWFRKRFAMLRDSRMLDHYTVAEIEQKSVGYDVSIDILQDKIVFPTDKKEAKRLLQFLNEEIFLGAITATLYETNSKRKSN